MEFDAKLMPLKIRVILVFVILEIFIAIIGFISFFIKFSGDPSIMEKFISILVISAFIIYFIIKRNKIGLRLFLFFNMLSLFNTKIFLSIVIGIILFILSFGNSVNEYLSKEKLRSLK